MAKKLGNKLLGQLITPIFSHIDIFDADFDFQELIITENTKIIGEIDYREYGMIIKETKYGFYILTKNCFGFVFKNWVKKI